jgi:hypothetical protein
VFILEAKEAIGILPRMDSRGCLTSLVLGSWCSWIIGVMLYSVFTSEDLLSCEHAFLEVCLRILMGSFRVISYYKSLSMDW